jgi:hypothetical protein
MLDVRCIRLLVMICFLSSYPFWSFAAPVTERTSARADVLFPERPQRAANDAEAQGVKGKVVADATKLLAAAIRHGGEKMVRVLSYLDGAAAVTFKRYSGNIANELDRIAKISDLTTHIVKERSSFSCATTCA